MSDKIAKRLFDGLLTEAGVDREKFYHLVETLERVEYIDPSSIKMVHHHSYTHFALMATYTGTEQIGRARIGRRGMKPGIREAVLRIYGDISNRSGIEFRRIHPSLDDEYCIGFADICLDAESYLMLVLASSDVASENL